MFAASTFARSIGERMKARISAVIPAVSLPATTGKIMSGFAPAVKPRWSPKANEAETAKVIEDGWLHTGKLGLIDSDHYIYITGRL